MQIHNDARFRQLSKPQPNAQSLFMRLLTDPQSCAAPGLIVTTRAGLAEKLGWKLKDFNRVFDELATKSDEHTFPMAMADWEAGLVFLPNGVEYQPPASPNAVKAWVASLRQAPECDLRAFAIRRLYDFLHAYSEAFREPFLEDFGEGLREPGAGAGAGAGITPKAPLASRQPAPSAAADSASASPRGSASDAPSEQHDSKPVAQGQDGGSDSDLEFDLDLDGDSDPPAGPSKPERRTTGVPTADGEADGDGWQLRSPTVPLEGKDPAEGCTICAAGRTQRKVCAPGLVFRRIDGVLFAAMCWGCVKIGVRNKHKLPVPPQEHQSITHWRSFEHELPEKAKARKNQREAVVTEAIANTFKRMRANEDFARQAADRAEADKVASEPPCDGCGMPAKKPGLVYGQLADGTWVVGLCPECGGSAMHAEPPKFQGPPIPPATGEGWHARKDTPCPDDPDQGFKWSQQAITATKNRLKAGEAIAVVQDAPEPPPDASVTADTEPQEPEAQGDAPEGDEFGLDEPPDTGLDAPATGGDDEFSLDDDVPL